MVNLLNLTKAEMRDWMVSLGEPAYRVSQIERWIYREHVWDFDDMTDLPRAFRARLANEASVGIPETVAETQSADGLTRKVLLRLEDRHTIETVLMVYPDAPNSPELEEPHDPGPDFKRRTVCISTQVGCPIGCPFCATGQAGYIRNLTSGEIVAQLLRAARMASPITNVVIMGMGEPFMKYDVTWRAIESLTDPARVGLGARRITVSTSGEVPGIRRLAGEKLQINLAVSLHAPDDALRSQLVPLNKKYPLKQLMGAVREYCARTRRRVTFEYALMANVNDRPEQAHALALLLKGLLCHVNLIPLNPTTASPYQRSPYDRVKAFERILQGAGIPTTLRVEKGIEISAGCGQLRQAEERKAGRPLLTVA